MLSKGIANLIINVIIVDGATSGASGIAQHMVELVINVVRRTILKLFANPMKDDSIKIQSKIQEKGQIGPMEENVPIGVRYMKLEIVMLMTGILRTSQTRSSHCFTIELKCVCHENP